MGVSCVAPGPSGTRNSRNLETGGLNRAGHEVSVAARTVCSSKPCNTRPVPNKREDGSAGSACPRQLYLALQTVLGDTDHHRHLTDEDGEVRKGERLARGRTTAGQDQRPALPVPKPVRSQPPLEKLGWTWKGIQLRESS